jgi:hypothetical protein
LLAALADAEETQTTQQILNTSNDYLELVREYWPKISLGNVQAMTVTYDALNNCSHFRDPISKAESIDDLDILLADSHQSQLEFARGIYFRCKQLVEYYDEFPGWQDLRLRAAIDGDIRSKLFMLYDFYRFRRERPREAFPFSPGAFLIETLQSNESMVFSSIGGLGVEYGMLLDTTPTTSLAWIMISCNIRGDCDDASSMETFCASMTAECRQSANMNEILRLRAGSDEAFAEAQRKAEDIYSKVQQQRYEELSLDIVW